MNSLLEAARILEVEKIKVQLTDVARTWWLAEEAKLRGEVTWKQFSDGFYNRFFP